MLQDPEHIFIKKNQYDPTAGFFYALGCSLLHFSLLVVILFVKKPDLSLAKEYDEEYRR